MMNPMLLATVIVFAVFVIIGYARGLFTNILWAGEALFSCFLSSVMFQKISGYIMNHTNLQSVISGKISDSLMKGMEKEIDKQIDQMETINGFDIPVLLKQAMIENNNTDVYQQLGVDSFYDYVGRFVAGCIISGIVFLIVAIFLFVFFKFLTSAMGILLDYPVVKSVDKIGGVVIGIVEASVIVLIVYAMIDILSVTGIKVAVELKEQIDHNIFLSYIENHNILLRMISDISKAIFL